mgnify:CR=1 FL=1
MILERTSAGLCSSLILSEKLYPHLLEIDRAEQERMDAMLPRMMEAAGVTEKLKAHDPMRWWVDEHAEGAGGGNNFSRVDFRMRF